MISEENSTKNKRVYLVLLVTDWTKVLEKAKDYTKYEIQDKMEGIITGTIEGQKPFKKIITWEQEWVGTEFYTES